MDFENKKIFIGVDEAGYGPNLGPLVIAATVWSAPSEYDEQRITEEFARFSKPVPLSDQCAHVPLGDSKKLYKPSSGLSSLEAGLLAILRLNGSLESSVGSLLDAYADLDGNQVLPWYRDLDTYRIPHSQLTSEEIDRLSAIANSHLAESEIQLLAVRAVVVDEVAFNSQLVELGSKGQLLSRATLALVATLLGEFSVNAEVFCDRQGGRKNYFPVLLDALPDEWFSEVLISNARCSYRSTGARQIDVHFSVGGDSFPPTAVASMMAKYLRERLMQVFNAFWAQHVTDIKPTAGYPVDAKRFRAAIEKKASQLNLDPTLWWRQK